MELTQWVTLERLGLLEIVSHWVSMLCMWSDSIKAVLLMQSESRTVPAHTVPAKVNSEDNSGSHAIALSAELAKSSHNMLIVLYQSGTSLAPAKLPVSAGLSNSAGMSVLLGNPSASSTSSEASSKLISGSSSRCPHSASSCHGTALSSSGR